VPRHPPSALDNLTTTTNHRKQDARVHCAILNPQPTHNPPPDTSTNPHTGTSRYAPGHAWQPERAQQPAHGTEKTTSRLFPQDPTGCPPSTTSHTRRAFPTHTDTPARGRPRRPYSHPGPSPAVNSPVSPPTSTPARVRGPWAPAPGCPGQVLLRKEVIQPHLPVRLPCYDFVPIASPTFDGSPPHGLGHRLRVLPTFVT
jgi:hypothetical protein